MGIGRFGFNHESDAVAAKKSGSKTPAVSTLVSGAPRFDGRETNTGAVFFLSFKHDGTDANRLTLLPNNFHLVGDAVLGSSFGYSIAVVDINQDGWVKIIHCNLQAIYYAYLLNIEF